jgi:transcriptional regulator with XRE-family HTH domain
MPQFRGMINIRNKEYIKAFGENLRKIRINRKMSQEDLANEADIPLSQIGRIERGEINTTISTVYSLAKAMKVDIKELFNLNV